MNIIYIITILLVYILFMSIHKTEKKQNLIMWLALSVIFILCYNILTCLMCTIMGVLCTLGNLSICNTIIIVILSGILIKTKKVQKYYCKISDVIFSIICLILVVFIAYKQYGFPFNIKYEITDGSSHYFFAQQFYENSTLLFNESTTDFLGLYNSDFRLPGAYVNEGILFKVFDNLILKTDLFVLFDLVVFYMSGILFYSLLKAYAKEQKKLKILAAIFSILYIVGYQLNSMLYGYIYLSLALDIIIGFLLLMVSYEKEKIKETTILPIFSLMSFGMFFSYAYFIPIIYIAIIINIVIKSIKNKEKVISITNVIRVMYLIIIPLILGATYFIILPLVNKMKTEISTIGVEGSIYGNYITNFVCLIPIFIAGTILSIKNKEERTDFSTILFILSILFAIILFIGYKLEIVSRYYFFKSYYLIWLLAICNIFKEISYISMSNYKALKMVMNIYISIYVIVLATTALGLKSNIAINDIFYHNVECLEGEGYILERGEIRLVERAEVLVGHNEMYVFPSKYIGRSGWMSVLYNNQHIYIDFMTNYGSTIEKWLEEKEEQYYLAYYKDYNEMEAGKDNLDNNSDEYKIIYNDEYGFILERK